MSKKYQVHLRAFDGDDAFMVIGEAAWNWINSPRPAAFAKGKTGVYENVPAEVLAEATAIDDEDREEGCFVTTGSCENDRALYLLGLYKYTSRPKSGVYDDFYNGMIY